jgi:hypothetical protein
LRLLEGALERRNASRALEQLQMSRVAIAACFGGDKGHDLYLATVNQLEAVNESAMVGRGSPEPLSATLVANRRAIVSAWSGQGK